MDAPPDHSPRPFYRADLDGLRGIAIAAVLLYHFFPKFFYVGFAGVDAFFVISGFLIAQRTLRERAMGPFGVMAFYRRRVKRLIPALLVVLVTVWVLGEILLLPWELRFLAKHIAAGAFFVGNFVYQGEAGYFDVASHYKPLLHLWSLNIEEQFYLVWPVLVVCTTRWRSVWVLLGAASFLSVLLFAAGRHEELFFFPWFRAWEFVVGALVGLGPASGATVTKRDSLTLAGGVVCALGLALLGSWTLSPTAWLAFPVIATALGIAAGPGAWLNRTVLSSPPLVQLGRMSYSLYLWHWPLLTFALIWQGQDPGLTHKVVVASIVFFMSWLTWRFVENPFRRMRGTAEHAVTWVCLTALLLLGLGAYGRYQSVSGKNPLLDGRLEPACLLEYPFMAVKDGICRISTRSTSGVVAFLGDSHAYMLYQGWAKLAGPQHLAPLMLGHAGCPPFLDVASYIAAALADRCAREMTLAINRIATTPEVRLVVLHFRASVYLEHANRKLRDLHGDAPKELVFERGLERTLDILLAAKKEVVFVHQAAELPRSPWACRDRPGRERRWNQCEVPRETVRAHQVSYRRIVGKVLAKRPRVAVLDPLSAMCDQLTCFPTADNVPLYWDRDHLSVDGAAFIIRELGLLK